MHFYPFDLQNFWNNVKCILQNNNIYPKSILKDFMWLIDRFEFFLTQKGMGMAIEMVSNCCFLEGKKKKEKTDLTMRKNNNPIMFCYLLLYVKNYLCVLSKRVRRLQILGFFYECTQTLFSPPSGFQFFFSYHEAYSILPHLATGIILLEPSSHNIR